MLADSDSTSARDLTHRLILRRAANGWLTHRSGLIFFIGRALPSYLTEAVSEQIHFGNLRFGEPFVHDSGFDPVEPTETGRVYLNLLDEMLDIHRRGRGTRNRP